MTTISDYVKPKGAVCITFDDGYATHYNVVRPLFNARNQKATFFVTSEHVDNTPTYMTEAQMIALADDGHEIGAHAFTHDHIPALTTAQRVAQYDDSKAALEASLGAGSITSWAYPYGDRSDTTDKELYLRYGQIYGISGGTSGKHIYKAQDHRDAFMLGRYDWTNDAQGQSQMLNLIRLAANHPVIVFAYLHSVSSGGSLETKLIEALDLAVTLDVPVITCRDAFPQQPLLVDGGFEDSALNAWYKIASTGSQVAESVADTPADGYTGSRSLHLQTLGDTEYVYVRQQVPIEAGRGYTLSAQARRTIASGSGSAFLRIQEMNYQAASLATSSSSAISSSSWGQITVARTFGQSAAFALIECVLQNVTGEAWFDHLCFMPTKAGVFG